MANEITAQTAATAIAKLIAVESMPALVGNLVMGNLVNRSFEPVLAQGGDTVNVPIPPVMSANNIADAGTVTNQNPAPGNAQVVLNTHAEATFEITDMAKTLAAPDLLQLYSSPAIIALAEKIEGDLLGAHTLLTANTAVGTGNTAITEATIDSAETALFNAKVPMDSPWNLILSGTAYGQLRQIGRFTEQQTAGNGPEAILGGTVIKAKNFNVYRSQYVKKPSTTTYNVAFHKNAIILAMRRLPQPLPGTGAVAAYAEMGNFGFRVLMSYNANTLASKVTIDCLYGIALGRNNHGIVVQS